MESSRKRERNNDSQDKKGVKFVIRTNKPYVASKVAAFFDARCSRKTGFSIRSSVAYIKDPHIIFLSTHVLSEGTIERVCRYSTDWLACGVGVVLYCSLWYHTIVPRCPADLVSKYVPELKQPVPTDVKIKPNLDDLKKALEATNKVRIGRLIWKPEAKPSRYGTLTIFLCSKSDALAVTPNFDDGPSRYYALNYTPLTWVEGPKPQAKPKPSQEDTGPEKSDQELAGQIPCPFGSDFCFFDSDDEQEMPTAKRHRIDAPSPVPPPVPPSNANKIKTNITEENVSSAQTTNAKVQPQKWR